jgi:hypothetical protein
LSPPIVVHITVQLNAASVKFKIKPNKLVELTACSLAVYRKRPCRLDTHQSRSSLPRWVLKKSGAINNGNEKQEIGKNTMGLLSLFQ